MKAEETYVPPGSRCAKSGTIPTHYLLSIDLEDIQGSTKEKPSNPARIYEVMRRCLSLLNKHEIKITFFAVGDLAKKVPLLIREIIGSGHEIGCHSQNHTPLDKLTAKEFKYDLMRNVEVLKNLGAERVQGFRAPFLSLVNSTKWVWDVLADSGFKYSSSVLPARNPLYGWEGFPRIPTKLSNGLWELPVSVTRKLVFNIPFAAGSYLRILPKPFISHFCKWYESQCFPIISYIHPYDMDEHQEKLKVMENPVFNWLLYYNRKSTIPKICGLLGKFPAIRFIDYVNLLEQQVEKV